MVRRENRQEMENWKRALIAGSAALSAICFIKGKRGGGLLFAGVSLATLASEYPEKFRDIRAAHGRIEPSPQAGLVRRPAG